jgi:hypothetical protein
MIPILRRPHRGTYGAIKLGLPTARLILQRATNCILARSAIERAARGIPARRAGPTRSSTKGYGFTASPRGRPLWKNSNCAPSKSRLAFKRCPVPFFFRNPAIAHLLGATSQASLSLGSVISRIPSPNMLNARMVMRMLNPAKMESQGALMSTSIPSRVIFPHVGAGG